MLCLVCISAPDSRHVKNAVYCTEKPTFPELQQGGTISAGALGRHGHRGEAGIACPGGSPGHVSIVSLHEVTDILLRIVPERVTCLPIYVQNVLVTAGWSPAVACM